jgi:hypothetical protein
MEVKYKVEELCLFEVNLTTIVSNSVLNDCMRVNNDLLRIWKDTLMPRKKSTKDSQSE